MGVSSKISGLTFIFFAKMTRCIAFQFWYKPRDLYETVLTEGGLLSKILLFLASQINQLTSGGSSL
jgi:hypothetical protein